MPPVPVHPDGLLASLHDTWRSNGWDVAGLARFRMGPEDDDDDDPDPDDAALEALSEDDRTALKTLTAADIKKLSKLSDDDRKKLVAEPGDDPRIREAREQAARQRRELKPFKELAKKHGFTWPGPSDQDADAKIAKIITDLEAKLTGKAKPDPKPDPDKPDPVDEDAIKSAARLEAEKAANARVVKAEIKVVARDLFADPDDAPKYVDVEKYEVDDDGDLVDPDELLADLKEVLSKKPHLAKKPGKPKPDRAQGPRGTTATGADAGRAEAERRFTKDKKKAAAAQ